jgi:hypothetical protein
MSCFIGYVVLRLCEAFEARGTIWFLISPANRVSAISESGTFRPNTELSR